MVRAQLPDARIGFFLHTPFPSADVFRVLPWRRELVDGVLGASLIGFQTQRRRRRTSQRRFACSPGTSRTAPFVRRRCADGCFGTYPIGIDPRRFDHDSSDRRRLRWAGPAPIQPGRKLLVGVDRLDYTKGIVRRLTAFEQLLDQHPDLAGTIEMFQLAVPTRDLVPSYVDHRHEVQVCVDRINRRFATPDWTPVRYALGSLGPAQLREITARPMSCS